MPDSPGLACLDELRVPSKIHAQIADRSEAEKEGASAAAVRSAISLDETALPGTDTESVAGPYVPLDHGTLDARLAMAGDLGFKILATGVGGISLGGILALAGQFNAANYLSAAGTVCFGIGTLSILVLETLRVGLDRWRQ